MNDLDSLLAAAEADFHAAQQGAELENAKARYLGKSGRLTDLLKGLGALPPEQKKALAESLEQRAEQRKEHARDIADETRLMSTGSYADATAWRAQSFVKHLGQTVGFAVIVLGLFLLGAWFIRSGVMADAKPSASASAPPIHVSALIMASTSSTLLPERAA